MMEKNLAESVAKTVAAKEGKIKAACIEVANIVNDWRTEIVGGLDADGASEVIESHVIQVMQVIQMRHGMKAMLEMQGSQVMQVMQVIQVSLAHLWVDFRVIVYGRSDNRQDV